MMIYVFFILAVLFLTIAHIVKTYRLSQFIEIYERPDQKNLLQALTYSYIINFFLPIKIGNLFRAWYAGRKMKNGKSFSLATIILDIVLDFFAVLIIYSILLISGFDVKKAVIIYLIICSILCLGILIANIFNHFIKTIIYKVASIFNDKIELKILKFSWFTITSYKDMMHRVNKFKLFLSTLIIWSFYIASYYSLSEFLNLKGISFNLVEVFNSFYGSNGLFQATFFLVKGFGSDILLLMLLYILLPLVLIYLFSFVFKNHGVKENNKKYIEILPHVHTNDRLAFLKQYFSIDNRDYFKKYIALNNDVAILEDYSAGSNATTMLCSKDGKTFYRKYSFGKDAEKLKDQIDWICSHEKKLVLTKVMNVHYESGCCSYDMPYVDSAVTCFNYVHTTTFKNAWSTLKNALDDVSNSLHKLNLRPADDKLIKQYIDTKVIKNIEKIENGEFIKPLLKYDYIYINGKKYHNLNYFKKYLNFDYLYQVFKDDMYSDIHGDFTIENIICLRDEKYKGKKYYIIDPNTGNVHDSPYLDYGKLLQSIHGGYEFLMKTKSVEVKDDHIDFLFTKSDIYNKLFNEVVKYLKDKFQEKGAKSIFYHEIIHWLRLMPYKIEKNGERSLLFYAGLLMVANDVEEMFEKNR